MQSDIPTSSEKIGTITFIKENTSQFVALGHSTSSKQGEAISGQCYNILFEGINKGSKDGTGNIIAGLKKDSKIGYIYSNSDYGVVGKIDTDYNQYDEVETGCWYDVKKGKAEILMALDGDELKSYDVEVIGINYINKNKNIKVKVTDEELIARTGGIVQGMSGTPLMQNRKANRCDKLCYNR